MSVVPLFGLMGYLAHYSGIGEKLFTTANKFIGHHSGGLAVATDVACAGFGAICGSVPATIATMGSIAYPQMKRYKYQDSLSCGIIAAGSSLSILIPPSVMLVVYGIATETSVGALFAGGILPGVLLCVLYGIAIVIEVKLNPSLAVKSERATWAERAQVLFKGGIIEVLIVFFVSIGGLFAGLFTPTEAGAVGAVGMLVICLVERKINFNDFMRALTDSVKLSAMVMVLVAASTIFGRLFALSRIPNVLGESVAAMDAPAWVIMAVIVLIYLIIGCFADAFSAVLITIPVFFPIVTNTLGYDPIWFCVMMVVVLSMGALTPPVGMNVFMTKGVIKGAKLQDIFRGIVPFLICQIVLSVLLIFFPWICTWLPKILV
jgi:tripartite ATP-independent transporter DctM subunit